MNEERIELLRRAYEIVNAVGRTEPGMIDPEQIAPEVWARIDPAFELHERADLPDAKVYRGREQSKAFWRKTSELFGEIRWEVQEIVDLGETVVVEARIVATGRGSDVPVESDETDVWWFRDGKVVRLAAFASWDEAMAAVEAGAPGKATGEP